MSSSAAKGLRDFAPDLLYVVVFGPGFGESIVLRIPGEAWIVVDGCQFGATSYPANLLREDGKRWSCVILTHPHLDHASGLEAVIDGPSEAGSILGCVEPTLPSPKRWTRSKDPVRTLMTGSLEATLARIRSAWNAATPAGRWDMRAGDKRSIGQATLQVLHPPAALVGSRKKPADPNRLSSPLLVSWEDVRLVLGSDLPESEWKAAKEVEPELERHAVLKIPHHGSARALHVSFLGRDGASRERIWVATPWNRGRRLPRFEDGEGLSRLLNHVDAVRLTGLPVSHDLQLPSPTRATRQQLRDGTQPRPHRRKLPGDLLVHDVRPSREPTCWVAVGLDARGNVKDERFGAGSVVVTEGNAEPRATRRK